MGLEFNKLQPVQFGEFAATPKLTTELKLRLQSALTSDKTRTTDGMVELTKVLANCFPENSEEVESFIESYMTVDDIAKLATFLLTGEAGLKRLAAQMEARNV